MKVKMKPTSIILSRLNLEKGGKVQKFFTAECARRMERFVPYREGTLSKTVIQSGQPTSNVGVDRIVYSQPYARYVYLGLSRNGKPLTYTKSKHPNAGPYWDRRMVSVDMDKITKAVEKYIRNGGKQ